MNKTQLNPQQQEAIEHYGSPLLIIAGAGSGKTMTLTHKMLYLITEMGFPPESILAITFTNKAAKEMKDRVLKIGSDLTGFPFIGTFHFLCGDILRRHFQHLGGSQNYVIVDSGDQKKLLTEVSGAINVDEKLYPIPRLTSAIDYFKNNMIGVEDCLANPEAAGTDSIIANVYAQYQKKLWENRGVDFSDMLFWTVLILERFPDILDYYQEKFKYLLVDEYQDTNTAQYRLVRLLSQKYHNLTVVGDFDQNIYSWRGANIRNILQFEKDYPGSKTILMEQNYRSTQTILNAANALIKNNRKRKEKNLWSDNESGDKIVHLTAQDEHEEARFIAQIIQKRQHEKHPLNEMVILYRVNALSRVLEEQLSRFNLPYRIVGGLKFFDRKEIKDLVAYLRLIHNPSDMLAFSRIVNVPAREIGPITVAKVTNFVQTQQCSPEEAVRNNASAFSKRTEQALLQFFEIITHFRDTLETYKTDKIGQLIHLVLDKTRYSHTLSTNEGEKGQEKLENLYEFVSLSREEELDLGDFLNKIALFTDMDKFQQQDAVTLMTLHNAKGLEFDHVFITGFEEKLLPHYKSHNSEDDIEEERRLCYVGITRGRKTVTITSTAKRIIFGEVWIQEPSRFLTELPTELLDLKVVQLSPRAFEPLSHKSDFGAKNRKDQVLPSFEPGDMVSHTSWGLGRIIKIDGQGEDAMLNVLFGTEHKNLILKYAPLAKVDY